MNLSRSDRVPYIKESDPPPRISGRRNDKAAVRRLLSPMLQTLRALFLAVTGLIVLAFSARLFLNSGLAWRCPFISLFHVPCPSCGSSRAFAALSEGHLIQAWSFNPLVMSAIPLGTLGFLLRDRLARYARWGWPVLSGAVILNWVYLYWFLPR